ncbi:MAG: hypothetical protein U9Q73_00490 [Nanoarchaeota archaeon]|nr:hypothetical protein [Nanoarchaeota archaeon]
MQLTQQIKIKPIEKKQKTLSKILVVFCIIVFLVGSSWGFYNWENNEKSDYKFILNGEEMENVIVCEEEWSYGDLEFLPCVINGTFGGLFPQTINWSLSPQENCHSWGGQFTGFNVYNETRAKEIYDSLLPKCFELQDEEISYTWLNTSKCFCLDYIEDDYLIENETIEFKEDCDEYNCGGGLIVKRR